MADTKTPLKRVPLTIDDYTFIFKSFISLDFCLSKPRFGRDEKKYLLIAARSALKRLQDY